MVKKQALQETMFEADDHAEVKHIPNSKRSTRGTPRLTEDEARGLLDFVDIIRDPLHGDIQLTAFERLLVDTPQFQRLRNINQLAMTYIAYPGAVHTRFIHSLGTLHVCSELIATCNKNAEIYSRVAPTTDPVPLRIGDYEALLARLCALLHDLAHVPFGHTFEKEAQLFDEDEWQDKNRHDLLLGQTSNLADCFRAFFETRNLSHEAADQLREDISLVLRTKRSDVATLPYPFVHDLVGNTICADLVDYVRRDMYYCGLNETYGDRFLKYLAVFPVRPVPPSGKHSPGLRPVRVRESKTFETRPTEAESEFCRVVLMGYRYNERHLAVSKPDVFGEAIDLVRRRLAVAQKLYFHRTKIAASAMLAEAAVSAGFKSAMEIWDKSDAEVLKWLKESKDPGAARLASRIIERKLYKPIYRVSYHPDDESPAGDAVWKAYERFVKPKERHQLALRLQELIGRALFDSPNNAPGAVVVSCPDHRMGLKAFDMLVMPQPTSEVRSLQMSEHRPTQHEIMAIQEKHENLWRLEVFVDPEIIPIDIADVFVRELAGAIQHEIGPRNEVSECATLPGIDLADLERRTLLKTKLKKHDPEKKITQAQLERLDELVMRSWKSEDEFEKAFVDFMVDNSDNGMTK